MDLSQHESRSFSFGFPRTRGDGPQDTSTWHRSGTWFPPHARGWTLITMILLIRDTRVSPARAGMDPYRERCATAWRAVSPARAGMDRGCSRIAVARPCGFPRTRGDGPAQTRSTQASASPGFPRTRGDGPRVKLDRWTFVTGKVSPARAGMDPEAADTAARRLRLSFPRTRGDGPVLPSARAAIGPSTFPPHARGWTP